MTVRALSPGGRLGSWAWVRWRVKVRQGNPMGRLARAYIVAAVAATVSLAGCSSTPEPTLPSFGPTPTATASSPQTPAATASPTATATATAVGAMNFLEMPAGFTAEQRAVGLAYQEYWKLASRAYQTPREPHPDLGKAITGEALVGLNGYVNKLVSTGRHLEGPAEFKVVTVSVSGATAKACGSMLDSSHEIDDVTGESKEAIDPIIRLYSATFTQSGGVWRVATLKRGC